MKNFYYNVNGTEFHDTVAFGKAWKQAVAMAKEEHKEISRTVIDGDKIKYEYLAKGGMFIDERFRLDRPAEIF